MLNFAILLSILKLYGQQQRSRRAEGATTTPFISTLIVNLNNFMPSFIIFYKKVEILWITTMRG
jgi:hypothetical protein